MFESSVNSEGIETQHVYSALNLQFESSVNSEGIETRNTDKQCFAMFESSVNSEGIETSLSFENLVDGLRAV